MRSVLILSQAAAVWAVAMLATAWVAEGQARSRDIDIDGGGGPGVDRALDCIDRARISLGASPAAISLGGTAKVSWSVRLPSGCASLNRLLLNGERVAFSGSRTVQPMSDSVYTLKIGIPGGTATLDSTTVSVDLPPVVRIKGSTPAWRSLLVQAVGSVPRPPLPPKRLVLIAADVDMDMSNLMDVTIAHGVTLTSEAPPPGLIARAAESGTGARAIAVPLPRRFPDILMPDYRMARDPRHAGPRLFTTTRPKPLFVVSCFGPESADVRIAGFRLHGPHFGSEEGDDNLERGIAIDSCSGVEIENMELAGWSGQAIYVSDRQDLIAAPEAVRIHDNFFHHNQHDGGNGYGVDVSAGAKALIERNVFDFNRHAIAASGKPGTGYFARRNLVLRGGGFHGSYPIYGSYYTHQFDVHGTDYCYPSVNLYHLGCGQAGEYFEMTENAFQYTKGNAIKVRGNPSVGVLIDRNVFAHGSRGDAIKQNGNSGIGDNITNPIEVKGSRYGIQTYGRYGVCDFDGDGKDDLFLATGATWWYASAGRMHWTYLAAQDATLDTLGLGDFDGDGRCDVFAVHAYDFMISSGGTGEWRSLGTFRVPFDQLAFADFNGDGIQDIFRRAPDGQWWAISPGIYDWTALQSSSFPLSALRFGHFDDDRIADVIAVEGGHWSVSFGGRTPWQTLNPQLSDALAPLLIGDIDNDGIDDIVRYRASGDGLTGNWEISPRGAGPWQHLGRVSWADTQAARLIRPANYVRSFAGRFDEWAGADVLALDYGRMGHLYNDRRHAFAPYSLFAF